jgi:hypothetical protein
MDIFSGLAFSFYFRSQASTFEFANSIRIRENLGHMLETTSTHAQSTYRLVRVRFESSVFSTEDMHDQGIIFRLRRCLMSYFGVYPVGTRVISKHFVKSRQMCWTQRGAHLLLQG